MKKIFVIILIVFAFSAFAQNNEWRLGVQVGFHGSDTKFAGGMSNAHARFSSNSFSAPSLDFTARYDYNNRWMLLSGLGFTQTGFDFAIAENYSLIKIGNKDSRIRNSVSLVQIPMLGAYKTNFNCNNVRYFIGCGIVMNFISDTVTTSYSGIGNEVTLPDTSYLFSNVTSKKQSSIDPRLIAGCEKELKKGGILSISFIAHFGTQQLMHAIVNYNMDGTRYQHEFTNNGNYFGLIFSYFFRNFGWEKQHLSEKVK